MYGIRSTVLRIEPSGPLTGQPLRVIGQVAADFQVGALKGTLKVYVSPTSQPRLILGRDFMTQTGIVPYIKEGYVQLPDGSRLPFLPTAPQLVSTTTIPVKVNINEGLSTGQARTLRQVIAGGAFATETTPFGRVKGFYHIVNTGYGGNPPSLAVPCGLCLRVVPLTTMGG